MSKYVIISGGVTSYSFMTISFLSRIAVGELTVGPG